MTTTVLMTPQNFSIPAGFDEIITFTVDPEVVDSLVDTVIWWRVYEQAYGVPGQLIIEKSSESPSDIVGIDSPLSFTVQLLTEDTIGLLRNYYHEATIQNALGEVIGGSCGIMTVTATENR